MKGSWRAHRLAGRRVLPSSVRLSCALLAGLLAGRVAAAPQARADDPRDTRGDPGAAAPDGPAGPDGQDVREAFGLGKRPPPAVPPSCGDGLAFTCAIATDPLDDATPYGLSTWLPGSYLLRLPVGDATHDRVASYAFGASHDEAGPVFGGASGLENRWTIDGAPADNLRTGGADTRVPLAFLDGIMVSAGGFSARDRASTGGTIDARLRRGTAHHEVEVDAWTDFTLAGKDRPAASGSYAVRRLSTGAVPGATASLVATGPIPGLGEIGGLGGTAWYAAGIAPHLSASALSWRAARLVDADGDGVPDGFPGELGLSTVELTSARTLDYVVPAMARVGLDRGPQHLELSLVGDVARSSRFLANSTLQAAGVDDKTFTGDAIATWRGTWADTHARIQLAWHRSSQVEAAHDPAAAGIPQLLGAYVPASLPEDRPLAAICDDTSPLDPARLITNCPVPFGFFTSGGAGPLTNLAGDRPTMMADLSQRIGHNVIRAGATLEDTRLVTTTSYTATEEQFSLFAGQLTHRRFYLGSCSDTPSQPCDYASSSQLTYRTVYAAAYAEDTFSPQDGLSVDGGLRWELMWVGTRLQFSHELAPRVGIAWDVLGGGRSRLWASLGRTFAMLPAGLGATVLQRPATVDDVEVGGTVLGRTHDTGAAFPVASGVEPVEQDEVTFGAEVALVGALRASVWGQGRFIRRALETTPEGFDNPGRNGNIPATRQTEIVGVSLEMAQIEKIAIRAGVMWGRTEGTWTGPYDPRQGANLLQGSDWDVTASNLYGPLPTDLGGSAFVEVERRGSLGPVGLAVATRLTVGSGRPRNVLADGADGLVELLPRGSAGRNPVIGQANLRLAARWRGVLVTLDLENVFDRQDLTNLDEVFTSDTVRPVSGGSYEDLVFLKNDAGKPATRRTAFQLPTAYQPPLTVSLGVHKAF